MALPPTNPGALHMSQSAVSASYTALFALVSLLAGSSVIAHPGHESHQAEQARLVARAGGPSPSADSPTATIGGLSGPTRTLGVTSVETLGVIELGEEFPAMQGRQMRARVFTIEPGAIIAIHAHEQRPGYALILSGSIVEHRNDQAGPLVRNTGDIAIEKGGVAHWWENVSGCVVKALVVDVAGAE
jgi:quercetin dioxygenase-like cupin family protein